LLEIPFILAETFFRTLKIFPNPVAEDPEEYPKTFSKFFLIVLKVPGSCWSFILIFTI
jgi:hypothetical protein